MCLFCGHVFPLDGIATKYLGFLITEESEFLNQWAVALGTVLVFVVFVSCFLLYIIGSTNARELNFRYLDSVFFFRSARACGSVYGFG